MIKPLILSELVEQYGGQLIGSDCQFMSAVIDTRQLKKGDLFIALQGSRVDGHDYLANVAQMGGVGAVITSDQNVVEGQSYWLVDNAEVAFAHIALERRNQYSHPVIGLTGSCGKTSVKAMIRSVLSAAVGELAVFATKGNLNNQLGVPLSILSIQPSHQYAVIEMGASAVGDIAELVAIAKPDVALVNNVMPAHVEGFGSIDNIAQGKSEIYDGLGEDGVAIINLDDHYSPLFLKKNASRAIVTFSCSDQSASVYAGNIVAHPDRCHFTLSLKGQNITVELPVPGKHNIYNALAAAACAHAVGIEIEFIKAGLENVHIDDGRLQIIQGFRGCRIIDDSYNANPGSIRAAIDVLSTMNGERLLVLGDMAELGSESAALHSNVGAYAKQQGIEQFWVIGQFAANYCSGYGEGARAFSDCDDLIRALKASVSEHSTVLVKGSRGARMERVVSGLKMSGDISAC